jgi:6-phosphogluconolactonase (cycloisomerase 2 family)
LVGFFGAGGLWPRHFTIKGRDVYVCLEKSDLVTHFRLSDWDTLDIEAQESLQIDGPSCVVIVRR